MGRKEVSSLSGLATPRPASLGRERHVLHQQRSKSLRGALCLPGLVAMRFKPALQANEIAPREAATPAKVAIFARTRASGKRQRPRQGQLPMARKSHSMKTDTHSLAIQCTWGCRSHAVDGRSYQPASLAACAELCAIAVRPLRDAVGHPQQPWLGIVTAARISVAPFMVREVLVAGVIC